jgi:hypothetical protein
MTNGKLGLGSESASRIAGPTVPVAGANRRRAHIPPFASMPCSKRRPYAPLGALYASRKAAQGASTPERDFLLLQSTRLGDARGR